MAKQIAVALEFIGSRVTIRPTDDRAVLAVGPARKLIGSKSREFVAARAKLSRSGSPGRDFFWSCRVDKRSIGS